MGNKIFWECATKEYAIEIVKALNVNNLEIALTTKKGFKTVRIERKNDFRSFINSQALKEQIAFIEGLNLNDFRYIEIKTIS